MLVLLILFITSWIWLSAITNRFPLSNSRNWNLWVKLIWKSINKVRKHDRKFNKFRLNNFSLKNPLVLSVRWEEEETKGARDMGKWWGNIAKLMKHNFCSLKMNNRMNLNLEIINMLPNQSRSLISQGRNRKSKDFMLFQ